MISRANLEDVIFPDHLQSRSSSHVLADRSFHGVAEKRKRKNIESQSATRDSVVSPGDSAVPARSFVLVREIMNGHTKREVEPEGRNTLIMSQQRKYGENKICVDVKPNHT